MHSPGRWMALDNNGNGLDCVLSDKVTEYGNFYVAECNVFDDAKLIAAAPDLLAALKDLQSEVKRLIRFNVRKHYSLMVADAAASKAIAKAQGGRQ